MLRLISGLLPSIPNHTRSQGTADQISKPRAPRSSGSGGGDRSVPDGNSSFGEARAEPAALVARLPSRIQDAHVVGVVLAGGLGRSGQEAAAERRIGHESEFLLAGRWDPGGSFVYESGN